MMLNTQQSEDEVLIDARDAGGNAEGEYGGPQPHVQWLQSATQPHWGVRKQEAPQAHHPLEDTERQLDGQVGRQMDR